MIRNVLLAAAALLFTATNVRADVAPDPPSDWSVEFVSNEVRGEERIITFEIETDENITLVLRPDRSANFDGEHAISVRVGSTALRVQEEQAGPRQIRVTNPVEVSGDTRVVIAYPVSARPRDVMFSQSGAWVGMYANIPEGSFDNTPATSTDQPPSQNETTPAENTPAESTPAASSSAATSSESSCSAGNGGPGFAPFFLLLVFARRRTRRN